MATPVSAEVAQETQRRVDRLCEMFRAEIMRLIEQGGRPREVRAVARINDRQLARDSHVEPARLYPLDEPER